MKGKDSFVLAAGQSELLFCFLLTLKLMKPLCVVGAEGRDTLHIWNFGNMPIFARCASAYPSVVLRCVQKMVIHDADCMKPKFQKL